MSNYPHQYSLYLLNTATIQKKYADFEEDQDLYDKVNQLINDYGIDQWDGFSGSDPRVADGDTFELEMILTNGQEINANGSNAYPENYGGFVGVFESLFNNK